MSGEVPGGQSTLTSSRRSFAVIALIAVAALTPELAIGLTVTDNYRFNLLWPEQFGTLFRSGHLYPRWLPLAWRGLGTPAFYFYPPVFFWVTSIVDTVTGGVLPPERFVPIGSLLLLIASGLGMRAWLRVHVGEQRALLGALAYMLAPYHLYDIYCRGALAESASYVSVPVVMLALARLGEGRTRYLPLLSLSYAVLLLSHLPSALLVSVLLIPVYVAWTARAARRPALYLAQTLIGGLMGIALAAIYLVPALTLLSFVNPASLTRAFYRPDNWFFWHFPSGPMGARMYFIIPVAIGAALLAAGTWIRTGGRELPREPRFWAALTIGLVILIAGLIPPFWRLPGLMMVQFPWRALLLVEFTTVTMLAMTSPSLRSPLVLGGTVVLAYAYVVLAMLAGHTIGRTWTGQTRTAWEIRQGYLDAPEYLPSGVKVREGVEPGDVEVDLAKVPLARASDARAKVSVSQAKDGGMTIAVDSPAATQLALRRYYFPNWRARDSDGRPVPVTPEARARIVTFQAPVGRSVFRLEPGTAPNEILARAISLVALALLAVASILTRRRAVDR